MTRDKSCYQLVDSMTEKRCHSEQSEESHTICLQLLVRFLTSFRNDRVKICHYHLNEALALSWGSE